MDFPHSDEKMDRHPPNAPPQCLQPVNPEASEIETYPEGGRDAWLVVLGAWCGLTASIGIYNTAGVLQVIVSKVLLPDESPSNIGWIFSIYAFITWLFGVQVGPTFDAMGPRALIVAGTVCTLVGVFALSVCTGRMMIPCTLFTFHC
jgi:MFS family permease